MNNNVDLRGFDFDSLAAFVASLNQPVFRTGQIFGWLHQKRVESFDQMTNLPAALRQALAEQSHLARLEMTARRQSADGTVKYLFRLNDGNCVETVAMRYHHGVSVCISTQVGCGMGCVFCASTVGGLVRNLTASEMLAQVYAVANEENKRVDSVVLMGIGEPLENFEQVMHFCDIITDPRGYNMAGRAITLSTCGIVPQIRELAAQKRQLTLAVSLHAATDAARSRIMPVNRRYNLDALLDACRDYFAQTGRRVTMEYAVIHGQNDSDADADALAERLRGMGAHVNLIPVNPARDQAFHATRADANAFAGKLAARGINATVRRTLGADIEAACGQLRRGEMEHLNGR